MGNPGLNIEDLSKTDEEIKTEGAPAPETTETPATEPTSDS